jgi:DNA (cytosine-5)-methyltransferase 1
VRVVSAPYRLLDLFSGIGGFSLGLERTGGFKTVAFCEIEEFPRRVLAKHWPKVPCYHDIRELTGARLAADGIGVDAICGGFPCQDISVSGRGAGIHGERSGLWSEVARLAGELRPQLLVLENSPALLSRGLGRVLGDLAALGYDAQWHCVPAAYAGAAHRRDRVWIVAYPHEVGGIAPENRGLDWPVFYQAEWPKIADAVGGCDRWAPEPNISRVANGFPNIVDRRGALGNAVVPQIPELIGNAILAANKAAVYAAAGQQYGDPAAFARAIPALQAPYLSLAAAQLFGPRNSPAQVTQRAAEAGEAAGFIEQPHNGAINP